jgi:hypothetical protein
VQNHPLADPAGAPRYDKAKKLVRTIYGGYPDALPKMVLEHQRKAGSEFWQWATLASGVNDEPSQATVDLVCDLIELIEACKE